MWVGELTENKCDFVPSRIDNKQPNTAIPHQETGLLEERAIIAESVCQSVDSLGNANVPQSEHCSVSLKKWDRRVKKLSPKVGDRRSLLIR